MGAPRQARTALKKASVRALHIRTSEFVREAAAGSTITIERRGEPVAELRPISKMESKAKLPDLRELWRRFPSVPAASGRFLEEDGYLLPKHC